MLRKLFKFHGGVKPQTNKAPSTTAPIAPVPLPDRLVIPLHQAVGGHPRPLVQPGDRVLKGQRIGGADGSLSSAVHASTSGIVRDVAPALMPHTSGLTTLSVIIEPDGEDRWAELDKLNYRSTPPDELRDFLRDAGVVGLGGAVFPSYAKLKPGKEGHLKTLVINGAECEPFITCDDLLMRERAGDMLKGIVAMRHMLHAEEVLIGIEDNKPEAIAAMSEAARGFDNITIVPVPARYPMGSDRQLIVELTGREVPSDARAADVGVIVHNVGTARAVHDAVVLGRPLVSRLVTVNGAAAAMPGNYEVPLGMLVSDLIAFTGGARGEVARLVMGGPMMGTLLPHARVPVVKGTSGILLLDAKEAEALEPEACIRCSSCVKACPMGLLPLEMSARIRNDDLDGAMDLGLADCIACGCCAYVCPSHIPLVQYFYHAKGDLSARERAKLRTESTKKLGVARQERLEREAREKAEAAARRKAERAAQQAAAAAAAAPASTEPQKGEIA